MAKLDKPFKLTKEFCIPLMREAYKAGKLSAQNDTPSCAYRDQNGNPCIIGACIPDEVAYSRRVFNKETDGLKYTGLVYGSVNKLDGVFEIDPSEAPWFAVIQLMHDLWAISSSRDPFQRDEIYIKQQHDSHMKLRDMLGFNDPELKDQYPINNGVHEINIQ